MALDDDGVHTRGVGPRGAYHRNSIFIQDAKECTVGPMPVEAFLDAFSPPIPAGKDRQILSSKDAFKAIPSGRGKPSDIYNPLLLALNRSTKHKSRTPGFVFANASANATERHTPGYMKPHICCYKQDNFATVQAAPASSRTEMGYAELFFEVKSDVALDCFSDPPPHATQEERAMHEFMLYTSNDSPVGPRAQRAFGQHISYAVEIQARQHRICLYSVSIAGSRARLLRWDRAGVIVTEGFDIAKQPDLLCEFLARFAFASDQERGHDVSAGLGTPQEELLFRHVVTQYVKEQLDIEGDALDKAVAEHYKPGFVVAVPIAAADADGAASGSPPTTDRYIVSRPVVSPLYLRQGRATRGYWAVQASTGRLVFLKDTWRSWGIIEEGVILAELNAAGVRNVPQLVAHGDVLRLPALAKLDKKRSTHMDQHTETDYYDTKPWACPINGKRVYLATYVHYRLVLGTVGYPICKLRGTDELLHATYDAFQAMRDALSKTSRLHRDISAGNIILVKEPGSDTRRGCLIDWETSSRCDAEGRSLDNNRVGTWRYMSIKLLHKSPEPQTLEDEMESLLYVVLCCALLYLPHSLSPKNTQGFLREFFDWQFLVTGEGELYGPGDGKIGNRKNREYTGFVHFANPDLQKWLDDVLDLHGPRDVPFSEVSYLWKDPENLDKLWREFLAQRTLARDDRLEKKLPEVPSLRREMPSSLGVSVSSAPSTLSVKRSPERESAVHSLARARDAKRRRLEHTTKPSAQALRRSERLRARARSLLMRSSDRVRTSGVASK